jgi:hypothetical protein
VGKTPMEIPGNEEPLVFRIDMGQPAGRLHCPDSAAYPIIISPNPVRPHTLGAYNRGVYNRGARTRACRVHTRVNASSALFAPTRPVIPQRQHAPAALSTNPSTNISRSHECERCTHECVRHECLHNKVMGQINWSDNGALQ